MADDQAFIGYRSAGRRRPELNDRRASADAPLAVLRGLLSGVAGAPGDIESLVRMLPGLSEQTVLPTSQDIERRLPLRSASETPIGRVATGMGQLGGGFYTGPGSPLRAVAGLPSAVSRAGRDFAMAAGQPAVNVVKPKGGNWLEGSVERAVEPMRQYPGTWRDARGMTASDEVVSSQITPEMSAMNRWLETKLAKYIRNEMATPEDPVRALAERGITHAPIEATGYNVSRARREAGFPEEGLATSPMAKLWEDRADTFVNALRASDLTGHYPDAVKANPWLLKVPPETPVYEMLQGSKRQFGGLGFGHLVDELKNAVNPTSGLPENLRLKYSDLEKVTVPQAVERVAKINEWRAAQKAEADMARAMGPATHVFKEYPEQGFKWVELKAPKETGRKVGVEKHEMDLPPDFDEAMGREVAEDMALDEGLEEGTRAFNEFVQARMADFGRKNVVEMDESYKALEDALKYEGETMGHCVGGYCPDVVEGRSKIFSLRDKKGQPHVTIEVQPGKDKTGLLTADELPPEELADMKRRNVYDPQFMYRFNDQMGRYLPELGPFDDEIIQIKGKANRAPNPEYLPAVQDFVRSGNWSKIGDLQNTGLMQLPDKRLITKEQFDEGIQRMTGEGESSINSEWFQRQIKNDPSWWENAKDAFEGFARGGQVRGYASGGLVQPVPETPGNYYHSDAMQNPNLSYKFSDGGQAGDVRDFAEGGEVQTTRNVGFDWKSIEDAAKSYGLTVPSFMARHWNELFGGRYSLTAPIEKLQTEPSYTAAYTQDAGDGSSGIGNVGSVGGVGSVGDAVGVAGASTGNPAADAAADAAVSGDSNGVGVAGATTGVSSADAASDAAVSGDSSAGDGSSSGSSDGSAGDSGGVGSAGDGGASSAGDGGWAMGGLIHKYFRGGRVRQYAAGGLVNRGGANFPTEDFDQDRINAIVDELHAMNAG